MFFKSVNNLQTSDTSLAALSSRIGRAMHYLFFYVSYGTATRFLRGGEKYYIYFVDNLLLFPTVKEFSKSMNI